jgi:hypothetical protein
VEGGGDGGCGWKLPSLLCLLLILEELPGPAPTAALAMQSAQVVSSLTLLIPMLHSPGLQLHTASAACKSACICLCLRCLESVSGRNTSFRLGPARVIGMVGAVAGLHSAGRGHQIIPCIQQVGTNRSPHASSR